MLRPIWKNCINFIIIIWSWGEFMWSFWRNWVIVRGWGDWRGIIMRKIRCFILRLIILAIVCIIWGRGDLISTITEVLDFFSELFFVFFLYKLISIQIYHIYQYCNRCWVNHYQNTNNCQYWANNSSKIYKQKVSFYTMMNLSSIPRSFVIPAVRIYFNPGEI